MRNQAQTLRGPLRNRPITLSQAVSIKIRSCFGNFGGRPVFGARLDGASERKKLAGSGATLLATLVFDHPTARQLAAALQPSVPVLPSEAAPAAGGVVPALHEAYVAGMSSLLPGAGTASEARGAWLHAAATPTSVTLTGSRKAYITAKKVACGALARAQRQIWDLSTVHRAQSEVAKPTFPLTPTSHPT